MRKGRPSKLDSAVSSLKLSLRFENSITASCLDRFIYVLPS